MTVSNFPKRDTTVGGRSCRLPCVYQGAPAAPADGKTSAPRLSERVCGIGEPVWFRLCPVRKR
jgi:hypothetical protein